jgi:hypothetical protein
MMNILEHILAGHYPTDDLGFPRVPREAGEVRIVSTTGPKPEYVLVGQEKDGNSFMGWDADGNAYLPGRDPGGIRLLPPPPRKVKVTRWAVIQKDGCCFGIYQYAATAKEWAIDRSAQMVELTGEYEEPWS